MRSLRSLLASAVLALVVVSVGACAEVREAVTGAVLNCGATSYDLCVQVADYATDKLPRPEFADITEVTVERRTCDADEMGDTACWSVEVVARLHEEVTGRDQSCGETPDDLCMQASAAAMVHQHADGTFGSHHTSIGSPPDT